MRWRSVCVDVHVAWLFAAGVWWVVGTSGRGVWSVCCGRRRVAGRQALLIPGSCQQWLLALDRWGRERGWR